MIAQDKDRVDWRSWHSSRDVLGGTEAIRQNQTQQLHYSTDTRLQIGPACLALNSLQGQALLEGDAIRPILCGANLSKIAGQRGLQVEAGITSVERFDASRELTARYHVWNNDRDYALRVTFREGISQPIRIQTEGDVVSRGTQMGDFRVNYTNPIVGYFLGLAGGTGITIELERFSRGSGPRIEAGERIQWPAKRPGARIEATDAWGPIQGDPTFRLPRDDAIQTIELERSLGELEDFDAWREDHPDARVVSQSFSAWPDNQGRAPASWWFFWRAPDGEGWWLEVEAEWSGNAAGSQTGLGGNTAQVTRSTPLETRPELWSNRSDPMPTIGSVIRAWQAQEGHRAPDTMPNSYSWDLETLGAEPLIRVGWFARGADPLDPTDQAEAVENASLLEISAEDAVSTQLFRFRGERFASSPAFGAAPVAGAGQDGLPSAIEAFSDPVIGGLAAGGILIFLAVLVKFGLLPLYLRLRRDEILDHEVRREIYNALKKEEGARLRDLVDVVDRDRTTVDYHLHRLEKEDLVASRNEAGSRFWFLNGVLAPAKARKEAILSAGDARHVYETIQANPGTNLSGVADKAQMHMTSVHRIVGRLAKAGLIERRRDGRSVALEPSDAWRKRSAEAEPKRTR